MKKISLLFLLLTLTVSAQKKLSVEAGFGTHTIADECADLTSNLHHIDGVIRYSFNEKFGIGLYGGFDQLDLENYITKERAFTDYWRISLEGVADVLEVADLSNRYFTILAHGGAGISNFDTSLGYKQTVGNVSGGLTGLVKVLPELALKFDYTVTGHFNQDMTFDGGHDVTNVGIQSFINNATVGMVVYLGNGTKKSDEHYDWYEEVKPDELAPVRNKIRDLHNALLERPTQVIVKEQVCCDNDIFNEYVYFDFDKYDLKRSELAAIESGIEKAGDTGNIKLVGYACPRFGSTEYNYELARKRVNRVVAVCTELGFPKERIVVEVVGKDIPRDSDNPEVRAMARRVDIIVNNK